jgi:GNAT superfamily N-acetyltransferase
MIGQNDRYITILPARKVDLTGRVALHFGKGNVAAGPSEAMEFVYGSELSKGGMTIFALPSRNLKNHPNILPSVEDYPNEFPSRELIDLVVTEYGVASLAGRTVRERAQALIDVAHPKDRQYLFDQAKIQNILYKDQIFLAESGRLYPEEVATEHTFKGDVEVRFRAIRPSDEEEMRKLFYRFSDKAVYYRYFSPIKTMPHSKMQSYVNVDFRTTMSIVGLVGEADSRRLIAEARYVMTPHRPFPDVAFVVDEDYQGVGIGSYLFLRLIQIAQERGIKGFTADILASNKGMMHVIEKSPFPVQAKLDSGVYEISIPFSNSGANCRQGIDYRT